MQQGPISGGEKPEVVLTGGNLSSVVRRGSAVHRTAGPWTPTIHRLLEHLHRHGISWVPRPLGMDERGREILTFLPGIVPTYPMPAWVWTDQVLTETGRRLAQLHQATRTFATEDAIWQIPPHEPIEVVCLNDVAPYNLVFDDHHQLSGLIDLDVASPGPRVWDLAYLAYRIVPLTQQTDTGAPSLTASVRPRRPQLLTEAYAESGDQVPVGVAEVLRVASTRLADLAEFTAGRAAAGADHVADHVEPYRADARWISEHVEDLRPG